MPKIKVKRKKRRGGFLSRHNFAQAMRDAINTGLNNIERIDPCFTENAIKRLARLLKRVTPVILKKLLNKAIAKNTFSPTW